MYDFGFWCPVITVVVVSAFLTYTIHEVLKVLYVDLQNGLAKVVDRIL